MRLARTAAWQAMVASSSFCRADSTSLAPYSRMSLSRSRVSPAMSPPASSAGAARTASSFGPETLVSRPSCSSASLFSSAVAMSSASHRQHRRHQQALARDGARIQAELQLLHDDALVRGVHVDQHQAGLVLREDVDAVQLREGIAERRGFHREAGSGTAAVAAAMNDW